MAPPLLIEDVFDGALTSGGGARWWSSRSKPAAINAMEIVIKQTPTHHRATSAAP